MKLKNVRVGDYIQAKKIMCEGRVKKGELVLVKSIESTYYGGDMTILIDYISDVGWVNHKDFRKAPKSGYKHD